MRVGGADAGEHLVGVEIDPESLDVVNFKIAPLAGLGSRYGFVSCFHMLNDFLVFKGVLKVPENQQDGAIGQSHPTLILASTDFTILDHCTQAKLTDLGQLTAASSNRVVTVGAENRVYLHEVDFEEKKLILLKSIVLDGVEILGCNYPVVQSCSHFCLLAKKGGEGQEENPERILLKFGQDLDLISHLRTRGVRSIESIYALTAKKVAFCGFPSNTRKCLYVDFLLIQESVFIWLIWKLDRFDWLICTSLGM